MPAAPPLHFDHLGLIVRELEEGRQHLAGTLGVTGWTAPFDDPGIGVTVQFGTQPAPNPHPTIELIAPLGDRSPVANALRKGTRILSHLAYTTPDLAASAAHLLAEGCAATGAAHPAVAYNGQRVQFFISPMRFMIELIEFPLASESAPGHQHAFANLETQPEPAR